jgi:hypothetical protein
VPAKLSLGEVIPKPSGADLLLQAIGQRACAHPRGRSPLLGASRYQLLLNGDRRSTPQVIRFRLSIVDVVYAV